MKEKASEIDEEMANSSREVAGGMLLDISRSGLYYQPVGISQEDLTLMKMVDRQYLVTPFYGARKMAAWLKSQGHKVNRKRVRRLMQIMGIKAIYTPLKRVALR